jgi:DNA invertase Pin-like site-specific DNA recombinase
VLIVSVGVTEKMDRSTKIVGYARISNRSQLHGNGLQEQTKAIENQARQILKLTPKQSIPDGMLKIYIERPFSGERTADRRPQLQAALADVCGCNGILIVRDATRLARTPEDNLKILIRLKENRCQLVSMREAISCLLWGIDYAIARASELGESRVKVLRNRMTKTAESNKAAGKHWGGVPFGYVKNEAGQLETQPEQFPIVLDIVERVKAGESLYAIAKLLNQQRIRTQSGGLWESAQVSRVYLRFVSHSPAKT